MARIVKASWLSSLSGMIGEIEIRQTRHGIVIAKKRGKRKKKPSGAQQETWSKFRKAVTYARKVLADFKRDNPNVSTVCKGKSVYHMALAEYLKKK